ncbi:MAG: PepSY domain-containing protein [Gammaproteobacteria bacterium]|nr:PepSY domain-containing protein [Gammaproteobacteria bacterium]
MTRHKKKPPVKLLRSLFIWHRYIGLAAALFVVVLALTGLVLNHTEELALDERHVKNGPLLDWYGVHAPASISSYRADEHILSTVGGQVYWNTKRVPQIDGPLLGALKLSDLVVAAVEGSLLLFTLEGDLIERLGGSAGVPAGMQAIGLAAAGKLAIRAAHGFYRTDSDFLEWHETDSLDDVTWSSAIETPDALHAALVDAYRGSGLSLERVLLDLHSGRILGNWGVYLMDAAAILFLLLAITGVWLWGKRRASAREHQRRKQEHEKHKNVKREA